MKYIYMIITVLLFTVNIYAQSPSQLVRVLKETNVAKLQADANIYRQQAEEQKAIAVQAALQNGWPITIETDSSFAELQHLNVFGKPMYYITTNVDAAISTSTNKLYPGGGLGLNLDGSGMMAGEWDGGSVLSTHYEFTNGGIHPTRITIGEASPPSTNWHSTHVAGTIMGGGAWNLAKGMAYKAHLTSYDWNSDNAEMASEAAGGLLISNHSYGSIAGWYWNGASWIWYGDDVEDNNFGYYSYWAALWDQIAVDAPSYLIVKSAGNDRGDGPTNGAHPQDGPYDCISSTGNAKNILTVGAVEDVSGGYSGDPNEVVMTSFSSWGPCDDGRIKPDICGNGYSLLSAHNAGDNQYSYSSGTSMSAPNVTGSLLLLQEHFYNLNSAYMKSATLKALAIQTADECGPDVGPDYMFGWGLLNAETAANVISNRNVSSLIKDEPYDETTYSITVTANGVDALRATLVWTDPKGTVPAYSLDPPDIVLVNDLDMSITGAKSIYSPYKLDKSNPSNAATTGDNDVDNVEQIHIASPTASDYIINITHEGSITGGTQNFSLIITGITIAEPAVLTYEPSNITANGAYFSGEATAINSSSITERGFVYSTSANPDINDTKIVVGSGLGIFNTTTSSLDPNTTYHVRAYATNSIGTGYGVDKDFTTISTTTWNGVSWDYGAPMANIHAIIDGNYTTSGDFNCNNLSINSGKIFNISVNDGATVNGNFENNGTFNILSNISGIGSLITLGEVSNSGIFNMQRYATEDAWYFFASPLSGNTSNVFIGSYMQTWDEITAKWIQITETSEPFVKGKGYAIWSPSKNNTHTFSGTPYSGNQSITMTKTANGDQFSGANLLGNPFPSSIDWNLLDGIGYGAVYTYDGINQEYLSWNGGAGQGDQYIAPGQGFFIWAEYTGTFNLGNADRTHLGTNNFVKEEKSLENGLILAATSENRSNELWISFKEDAIEGYEKKYDAYKFFSDRADLAHIYSMVNDQILSIDARPETDIIQLGFKCGTNGIYQIHLKEMDGIASIELEDTKLQQMHDLKSAAYEFEWSINDMEERFKLHLNITSTQELNAGDAHIYSWGEHVYIRNVSSSNFQSVQIIDLAGRIVYHAPLNQDELNMISLKGKNGIYLVQLISDKNIQTEKVFIGQ